MNTGKQFVHERHEKHEMKTLSPEVCRGDVPAAGAIAGVPCSCVFVSFVDNKGF
jgi:hypothetical protein